MYLYLISLCIPFQLYRYAPIKIGYINDFFFYLLLFTYSLFPISLLAGEGKVPQVATL